VNSDNDINRLRTNNIRRKKPTTAPAEWPALAYQNVQFATTKISRDSKNEAARPDGNFSYPPGNIDTLGSFPVRANESVPYINSQYPLRSYETGSVVREDDRYNFQAPKNAYSFRTQFS
jgi:hypothetical protein